MRLELRSARVERAAFGSKTHIADNLLQIDRDELRDLLSADSRLRDIEIELANPGDDCRIIDIFDIFEPRSKLDGKPNFPGLIDAPGRVGDGATAVARGAAVLVINANDDRFNTVVDMRGPAATLSPYASTANVCIRARPAEGVDRSKYYLALKLMGARAAVYIGDAAARSENPAGEIFDLARPSNHDGGQLPRVAYIYMLASQQVPTEPDEPILYGDNVRHLVPTVLHPNEILDGAVIAPYWNFGAETFTVQNHPMVLELYRRHGVDVDFAGVIAIIAAETEAARSRTALMAANLARYTLSADAVVITKYGGGIPESAVMETYDACEDVGMKGAIAIWAHGGDGRIEGTLTFMSPRADAVVSCGISDDPVEMEPMARVIGRETIGPLIMEREDDARPSGGALTLRYQHIAGGINQLGGGFLSSEEY